MNVAVLFIIVIVIIISISSDHLVDGYWRDCKARHDGLCMCSGTANRGANVIQSFESPIDRLKKLYENCSIVDGNLEIDRLTEEDIEKAGGYGALDFLSSIEQVNGYVLLAGNNIKNLSIPNLRIIWGDTLYKPVIADDDIAGMKGEFGLIAFGNEIETLDLSSLRVVHRGDVGLFLNPYICYWKTIDFRQILGDSFNDRVRQNLNYEKCDKPVVCADECQSCFGPSVSQCQKIYRSNCAEQCSSGMCFNSTLASPQFCCHAECTGGCYGPTNTECYGCNKFQNNEKCVDKCPPPEQYIQSKTEYEKNPNGTYAYQRICLTKCPSHTLIYRDGCVSRCPENHYTSDDRVCTQCSGNCPKTCTINEMITGDNIAMFKNCTKVEGYIGLNKASFENGTNFHSNGKRISYKGITIEDLELLSNIEVVTDYVQIQVRDEPLSSLGFLRNLQTIEGRKLFENKYSLQIVSNTALYYLELTSLKKVLNGMVLITNNYDLCYSHKIPWASEIASDNRISEIKFRNEEMCQDEGSSCDSACDLTKGCWGPGPNMCYECKHWKLNNTCVESCLAEDGVYEASRKVCDICHPECIACNGSTARHCFECRNANLNNECLSECPSDSHYLNTTTKTCEKCHENCFSFGCTGPGNFVGLGGCKKCKYGVYNSEDHSVSPCLFEISYTDHCSKTPELVNYYWAPPTAAIKDQNPLVEHGICMKCLNVCKSCSGYGQNEEYHGCMCISHRVFRRDMFSPSGTAECAFKCPPSYYKVKSPNNPNVTDCYPCHPQCDECNGPDSTDCVKCKMYKFQIDEKDDLFNCTDVCPPDRPHYTSEKICSEINVVEVEEKQRNRTHIIIAVALSAMCVLLILVCIGAFVLRRRTVMLEKLNRLDENYEVTDAKPDLSQLRLIVELELKKGGILGYGAFGTVYKGIYAPQDNDKMKIPVAIKVLHEAQSATAQQDMLDEAGHMARVNHPYLVRLIGVCLGQQMMLVTPLMPLGNLLDYIQKNHFKIGSSALLRWCSQIASGMAYLEELRLVHRDLAARNVLVQNPHHVRITDFGLAKMLDYGEQELKIAEGKMPIKWLALECIQYRRYTHKSDVWAYGVTVWELLTFGDKPYKEVPLLQIPALLEKGERLPQPKICTLDVYMILIKCWMVDADSRPTFKELHETFSKMSKDPGRYLVIEGDKLLRLPSYTPQDQRDMMRQFVDDPDVCDLEEYLHQISAPSSPTSPVEPMKLAMNDIQIQFRDGGRLSSTSSHRYASDPLNPKSRNVLTMDVDNYLVPDSQNLSQMLTPRSETFPDVTYTPVFTGHNTPNDIDKHVYYNELPDETCLKRSGKSVNDKQGDVEEYLIPTKSLQKSNIKYSNSPSKNKHYVNSSETEEFINAETVI